MNDKTVKLLNTAQQLFRAGNISEAEEIYRQVIELEPKNIPALLSLGTIALKEERLDEASSYFKTVLKLDQNHLEAHLALGAIAHQNKNFEKSIAHYEKALITDPDCVLAHNDLALIYRHEKPDIDKAFYHINKSLSINPGQLWPSMILAELLTMTGNWEEGFKQNIKNYPFYENYDTLSYRAFQALPRWQGGPIPGKKLIVGDHAGFGGFGDIIMFSRYLPLLKKECGGHITLPVRRQLWRLFENFQAVDQLILYEVDEIKAKVTLENFDFHIPLIFLPAIFVISLNNFPSQTAYLPVCPDLAASWKSRIFNNTNTEDTLKVGLVWNGNQQIARRSCSLKDLAPLGLLDNITYYSLQIGDAAKEITESNKETGGLKIIDLTGHIEDFADTAAFISNLDLVISIDTAVAHLTGAIGKPVWLILHQAADCKWLLNRPDTPWYPTMRLFRSKVPDDWNAVIQEIYRSLQDISQKKKT